MLASVLAFRKPFTKRLLSRSKIGLNLQDVKWGGLAPLGQRRDKIIGPSGASTRAAKVQSAIHFLVDADASGLASIRWAIGILQQNGARDVRTKNLCSASAGAKRAMESAFC